MTTNLTTKLEEILETIDIDFDYIFKLTRVKYAELNVGDFDEYGEEMKNEIRVALQSYGDAVRQEVIEELRPILIKAFELSEHAVVEREGNAFVVSTDYKAMVNKALSHLRSTQPKEESKSESKVQTKSDFLPFEHGDEGTHYACKEIMEKLGGKVGCCGCNKHDCKTDKDKPTEDAQVLNVGGQPSCILIRANKTQPKEEK